MARTTDQAAQEFNIATTTAAMMDSDPKNLAYYSIAMGSGSRWMALALRDVYDKLEAIDRKLDIIMQAAARIR